MKFSVSTYSFGGYIDKLGIAGVIRKAAEMGFEGIEFAEGGWSNGLDKNIARECHKIAADSGLDTVSYCVGADFLYGSGGDLQKEIDRVKAQVDFAKELGVTNMRHDVAYGMRGTDGKLAGIGYDNALPRLAEGCRKVTEYAESAGVGTMTENHGYFSQDANRVEKLINTVDHKNFGALVDIGNFMCADEEPEKSVGIMAPYAKHVHCKDFHYKSGTQDNPGYGWFPTRAQNWLRGAILGHGVVPVGQCIRILKANGYTGYLSIEFEGIEDNILGITQGLECLKKVAR